MAVSKNAHTKLALIYSKNLRVLAKMPSDYAYRKHTEQIVTARAALVKSVANVSELETKINGGQIEEVVIQAENELNLSRKILEWKSWEPLIAEAPVNILKTRITYQGTNKKIKI
jgi:NADH dehydrogenase (ubiquinone) 1 alpha subcomplex subunit 5